MVFIRFLSQKIFGRFQHRLSQEEAHKYLNIARVVYFFSAGSVGLIVYNGINRAKEAEDNKDKMFELGKPIIEDTNPEFRRLREKGVEHAVIYNYTRGQGLTKEEYNRDLYLQELEKAAYFKAKEAQRKALEEERELPPGALKLVD